MLMLPITTLAQTPAVPVSSIISAPSQVIDVPDEIVASGDGQVIASAWDTSNALVVRIATPMPATSTWEVQQTLTQPKISGARNISVAISNDGNIIALGDPNQGKVFVYSRPSEGGMWSSPSTISGTEADRFGSAVALNNEGNILAVAAPVEGGALGDNETRGAVYIYERADVGEAWTTSVTLRPTVSDGRTIAFGLDVALSGNGLTLAVGTQPLRPVDTTNPPAVHVFSRAATDAGWDDQPSHTVTSSDLDQADFGVNGFGNEIALNTAGDVLALGSRNHSSEVGAVYIFQLENGGSSWQEQPPITPGGTAQIRFGTSIDLNGAGDRLVVGAPVNDGATYLYGFNEFSGNWAELNIIPGETFASQGAQVALNNEYLVASEYNSVTFSPQLSVVELDSVISDLIIDPENLPFTLNAGESGTVNVKLEYVPVSQVTLRATFSGEGLTIEPSEISVADTAVQTFTVTAAADIVSGEHRVTFSADGYSSQQLLVTASNTSLLGSLVLPDMVEITEGASAIMTPVTITTVAGKEIPDGTSATVTIEGQDLAGLQLPQFVDGKVLLTTLIADGMGIIAARDGMYTGIRNVTITLDATDYAPATMTLRITDSTLDNPPQLMFDPNLLVSRGVPAELNISIDARASTLRIVATAGDDITVSPAVLEFGIGETVKTITVTADEVAENTYELYSTSSVSFDVPNSPEVEVVIEGQFNAGESADSNFGKSIAMSGNGQVMAVGTISADGSVDVYTNRLGYWEYIQTLTASNGDMGDMFGSAIAISDDGSTLAISAPEEDSTSTDTITGTAFSDEDEEPSGRNAGAVYIFTRGGNDLWTQQTYIKAANASANANFGVSLALSDSGDILAVGADGEIIPTDDGSSPTDAEGAVYIFGYEGTWSQENYLKIESADISTEAGFGTNVALSGDGMTLAVGSPEACNQNSVEDAGGGRFRCRLNFLTGTVHVFTSDLGDWSSSSLPPPVSIDNDYTIVGSSVQNVGNSVALNRDGMTLIVGIPDGSAGGASPGVVDIFTKRNNFWGHRQRILPIRHNGSTDIFDPDFGADVTVNSMGTVLAIGLPGQRSPGRGIYQSGDFSFTIDNSQLGLGAVYMYRLNDDSGMYEHLLSVKSGLRTEENLNYGTAVSLNAGDGGRGSLAIGAAGLFEIISYNEGAVIIANPHTFNLNEGSTRNVSVNLVQIGNTDVTVTIEAESGLEVEPNVLTFSNTEPQSVIVTATNDEIFFNARFIGDRSARLTLTAEGYSTQAVVNVNIIEDDLRPDLMLPALSSTQIGFNTDIDFDELTVNTTDAVSPALITAPSNVLHSRSRFTDTELQSRLINLYSRYVVGGGTATFIFSKNGRVVKTQTINFFVTQLSLIIEAVDTFTLNGDNPETPDINIALSSIPRENEDVLVNFEIAEVGGQNLVDVQIPDNDIQILGGERAFNAMFNLTRRSGMAGNTTLRVTAFPPPESAESVEIIMGAVTKDIAVRVNRPSIGLTVTPSSLNINVATNEILTVNIDPLAANPRITVTSSPLGIVSVMNNFADSGQIVVTGLAAGETVLTIRAEADDHMTETTQVRVRGVDDFRIETAEMLTLDEGGRMNIDVGLSQLRPPEGVTVNITVTGDLDPISPIMFTSTAAQSIEVSAPDNDDYTGNRNATLTLTATGYPTKTVRVTITDDELQPIGLNVRSSTELSLVRFASTNIEVSVENSATLEVETAGAVSLSADGNTSMVTTQLADSGSTQVAIYGVSGDEGTVRFTVSGAGKEKATRELRVTVTRPTLEISEVSPRAIDLLTSLMTDPQMANLDVRVNAIGNHAATITATVSDEDEVRVDPSMRIGVANNTPARFVVHSGITKENPTITITASHPLYYDSVGTDVAVMVSERTIGLTVMPSTLNITAGMTETLRITAAATTATVTITAEGPESDIIRLPDGNTYELTQDNPLAEVDVIAGSNTGETTLRIMAEEDGYATETTRIQVNVLEVPSIETDTDTVIVYEGMGTSASATINVNLSRVDGGPVEVSYTMSGDTAGVSVAPPSPQMFDSIAPQPFTVTVADDSVYTGDRRVELTFMAMGYMDETVTVDIREDELQPIGLNVNSPADLSLVRFASTNIEVSVENSARLEVETAGAVSLSADGTESMVTIQLADSGSTQVAIYGVSGDEGTVRFTVSGAGKETATRELRVTVTRPTLVISAVSPSVINLDTSEMTDLAVTVSAAGNPDAMVTVMGEVTGGDMNIVTPLAAATGTANMPVIFTVGSSNTAGNATLTITVSHDEYNPASTEVAVNVNLRDISLRVDPSALNVDSELDIVFGMDKDLTIDATANVDVAITVESNMPAIASVASAADFTLAAGDSGTIAVSGDAVGNAQLTIEASAAGYATETETINVNVQSTLRIVAVPDMPTLTEGEDTTIGVRLSRIDGASVTVDIAATNGTIDGSERGLNVTPISITFTDDAEQSVTVTAVNDDVYTPSGPRVVQFSLTDSAGNYMEETVTVTITDDELQPIGLNVNSPADLSLVRFASTNIEVSVENSARLEVETAGAVSLSADGTESMVTIQLADSGSTQVAIYGVSGDEGTVRFTVSGAGKETATRELRVTVTRPTLVISAVSPSVINLDTSEMTDLAVTVSAAGNPDAMVTVMGEVTGGDMNIVTPLAAATGTANMPVIFTVGSSNTAGNATLTITVSHDEYNPASTEVAVNVNLRDISLRVDPSALNVDSELDIVFGMDKDLTIDATANVDVAITVESNMPAIASVASAADFTLAAGDSGTIAVSGDAVGNAQLTIEASAAGYATETETINVNVQSTLRIVAVPDMPTLTEGEDTTIGVRLSRIDGASVTVDIAATNGTIDGSERGLNVTPISITFTDDAEQSVTVTAVNDDVYTPSGPRVVQFSLTDSAGNYMEETVTVTITDDELQPIGLNVNSPADLSLVRFASTNIEVSVENSARLEVETAGAVSLSADGTESMVTIQLADSGSTQVAIYGVSGDEGTVRFTVSGAGKETATRELRVTVTRPTLVISAVSPSVINLDTSEMTDLAVTVSAAGNPDAMVTVMGEVTGGDMNIVTPLAAATGTANMPVIFTVGSSNTAGNATLTITVSHDEYNPASTEVAVNVNLRDISLRVDPSALNVDSELDIVFGMDKDLTIDATANVDVAITVESNMPAIASVASAADFTLAAGDSGTIAVSGDAVGNAQLTIEASAAGYATETETINVNVQSTLRIVAVPDMPTLTEGEDTTIGVRLSRIDGASVTVDIAATNGTIDGSERGLNVTPISITFTDDAEQSVTVTAVNDDVYTPSGPRVVQFSLTDSAGNYMEETVTVTITDDELQPIGLNVNSPADLSLVRFASTNIEVSVENSARLEVETAGAVSLSADGTESMVTIQLADSGSTQVAIYGVSGDEGTVRFTVSGAGKETATRELRVTVTRPTLVISAVSPSVINLDTSEMTDLAVTVSAAGNPDAMVTVMGEVTGGDMNIVTPLAAATGTANMPVIFTVGSSNTAGNATLTITVSHDEYNPASTEVAVNVNLRDISLRVDPSALNVDSELDIVFGMDKDLTIDATANVDVAITVESNMPAIASVASAADFTLAAGDSGTIAVSGDAVGNAQLTIEASAAGYATETETINVNVQSTLRIVAVPDMPTLTEGEDTTIGVRLSRIDGASVTVDIAATNGTIDGSERGLNVTPISITFTDDAEQSVTVTAVNDDVYTPSGPRVVQFSLTDSAGNYMEETVTVTITDDELQPIGLNVNSPADLSLVRFASTNIEVSVENSARLEVETAGAVSLSADGTESMVTIQLADSGSTQVAIYGVSGDEGTVRFTVSGAGKETATRELRVTVTRPTLVISAVSPSVINLDTSEMTDLAVTVSAAGNPDAMVTVMGEVTGGDMNIVTPLAAATGTANMPVIFTVGSSNTAGNATLTITVSHDEYNPASTEVAVNVNLRDISLRVDPSALNVDSELDIVFGMDKDLTIDATANVDVAITVESNMPAIASVASAADFTLAAGDSGTIAVSGDAVGNAQLTIEASAAGYATETETINVNVQSTLRIVAVPDMPTLTEGEDTTIGVRLSRIDGASVTVDIAATNGTIDGSERGLNVTPISITFTDDAEQSVTVTAVNDNVYTPGGPRVVQFRLTATDYTDETVTVTITDDELQPIGLNVNPLADLSLVRFASTNIEVSVENSARLEVETTGAVSLSADGTESMLTIQLADSGSTQVAIYGVSGDEGTVRFTVSGAGKETATRELRVTVTRPTLVISAVSPSVINLDTSDMTNLAVTVSTVGNPDAMVTVMGLVTEGDPNIVTSLADATGPANMPVIFPVSSGVIAGNATLRITVSHDEYNPASTEVAVNVNLRDIGLRVDPSALNVDSELDIVFRMDKDLTIDATANVDVAITVESNMPAIASVASVADFTLAAGDSGTIAVSGDAVGNAQLTIEASAAGYSTETVTVPVNVLDSLFIELDTLPRFDLVENASTDINVNLNRVEGTEVTVTLEVATATTGLEVRNAADTLISNLIFTDETPQMISVIAKDNNVYDGSRTATLMLTAPGYATQTVTVDITEDERSITLDAGALERTLLRFATSTITVDVGEVSDGMLSGVSVNVEAKGSVRLVGGTGTSTSAVINLAGGSPSDQIGIVISGNDLGAGTVTFTTDGDDVVEVSEVVEVRVSEPRLMFVQVNGDGITTDTTIELAAGGITTNLSVAVGVEAGDASGGTITLTTAVTPVTGDPVTVSLAETTDVDLDTSTLFTVESGPGEGTSTITITARHPNYEDATVRITVNVTPQVSQELRFRLKVFLEGAQ